MSKGRGVFTQPSSLYSLEDRTNWNTYHLSTCSLSFPSVKTCHGSKWTRDQQHGCSAGEAITFECQKIIRAEIFSNISKGQGWPWGGTGNDWLLLPVTVHNSISNILPFKSLRPLLMYLAHLIYCMSLETSPSLFSMYSFVIELDDKWQQKWNFLYCLLSKITSPYTTLNGIVFFFFLVKMWTLWGWTLANEGTAAARLLPLPNAKLDQIIRVLLSKSVDESGEETLQHKSYRDSPGAHWTDMT